jgi:integrase
MPYADIGAFMVELRKQEGVPARALEFAILTAARTGEVVGARWNEIDLPGRRWTVPASRMKTGKEHAVPLSSRAVEILNALPDEGDFVFIGSRAGMPIGPDSMRGTLGRKDITVHGFRSTFRTWAAERTNSPREIAEMALAHSVGSDVEQAYRRTDMFEKRRKFMEAWAAFCARPALSDATVTPLRRQGVMAKPK